MARVHSKQVDALAPLASKTSILNKAITLRIIKKTLWASVADLRPANTINEQDRLTFITQNLISRSSTMATKELKDFVLVHGKFYFQGSGRVLAHALSMVSMSFLVVIMISVCLGACRGKGIPAWNSQEGWLARKICKVPRISQCRGIFICLGGQGFEIALSGFPLAPCIAFE